MPRPVEAARPHKVNGFWFLVRRVPAEFATYDTRKLVRQSTGIRIVDDPRAVRAGEVVAKLHSEADQARRSQVGQRADRRYRGVHPATQRQPEANTWTSRPTTFWHPSSASAAAPWTHMR
jgi:hypothetical protein